MECWAKRALSVRVCNLRDFKKALTDRCLDESKDARASGAWVGAIKEHQPIAHVTFPDHHPRRPNANFIWPPKPHTLRYEPRCEVFSTWKDSGAHTDASPCGRENSRCVQEFRQELQAAETKDKKFTKRKTVLKKIVANITMGNDSACCCDAAGAFILLTGESCFTVSPLFTDVVQCLGTPLLEIKKSMSACSITSLVRPSGLSAQWFTSFSSIMDGPRRNLSIWSSRISFR